MLTTPLIEQILATIPHKSIGLIGDLFLDRYLDIDPARDEPSIETGLTAYQVTRVRSYPGALGTVMNNLAALGVGRIEPIAIIGDDGEGYELRQALHRLPSVDLCGLVIAPDRRTPTSRVHSRCACAAWVTPRGRTSRSNGASPMAGTSARRRPHRRGRRLVRGRGPGV